MLTSTLNTALVKPKICRQDGKDCAVLVIMSQSICFFFFALLFLNYCWCYLKPGYFVNLNFS